MTNLKLLSTEWITPEKFKPFGQVIFATADGKSYDDDDAHLSIHLGTPRFYIMRLHYQGLKFHHITRHTQCTQCLGALESKDWFLVVAPPTEEEKPKIESIKAFQIPGNCFIKLEVGTWHAGPYFNHQTVDFYNLELKDTNITDHFSHNFIKSHNLEFELLTTNNH